MSNQIILPFELINHILSFRPTHPIIVNTDFKKLVSACKLEDRRNLVNYIQHKKFLKSCELSCKLREIKEQQRKDKEKLEEKEEYEEEMRTIKERCQMDSNDYNYRLEKHPDRFTWMY